MFSANVWKHTSFFPKREKLQKKASKLIIMAYLNLQIMECHLKKKVPINKGC